MASSKRNGLTKKERLLLKEMASTKSSGFYWIECLPLKGMAFNGKDGIH